MMGLAELLRKAVEDEASDVFIVAGKAASEKVLEKNKAIEDKFNN